jgi:hypothetical protein
MQTSGRLPPINPTEGEAIWREAASDVQQERLNAFVRHYGGILAGIALALVLSVAGWQGWKHWKTHQAENNTAALAAVVGTSNAETLSALAVQQRGAASALAALRHATSLKTDKAVEALVALSATKEYDSFIRDSALIAAGLRQLELSPVPAAMEESLQMLSKSTSAFRFTALEILALNALNKGDKAETIRQLTSLSQQAAAPEILRTRTDAMLAVLTNQQ